MIFGVCPTMKLWRCPTINGALFSLVFEFWLILSQAVFCVCPIVKNVTICTIVFILSHHRRISRDIVCPWSVFDCRDEPSTHPTSLNFWD